MQTWLPRTQARYATSTGALASLFVVGCALLVVGLLRPALQSAGTVATATTSAPNIEVRARFSNLAPGGQTTGFVVAPDGSLGIVDRGRQRVVRLDSTGLPTTEWGPRFEADADAQDLGGIAVSQGIWYLLDRGRARIYQLDSTGRAQRSIDLQSLGTYGPNGLAADADGNIYLADTGGNRLLAFNSSGALVRSIGTPGAELGELKQPMGLSFGPDGAMYIADFENSRIERWDAAMKPTNAWRLTEHSWGVAVDGLGRVFVPSADRRLVRMFDARGDLLAEIGAQPEGALAVDFPTQVALTPDGSALWVLGRDGLARVDLSPYSAIIPSAEPGGSTFPFTLVGAVLAVVGLAPLALRFRLAPAPGARVIGAQMPQIADAGTPATTGVFARRPLSARARTAVSIGIGLLALGALGVIYAQLSFAGPTGKNDPWPRLAVLVIGGIVWAAGCAVSARGIPLFWVAPWSIARGESVPTKLDRQPLITAIIAVALCALAGVMWWAGRFETPDATRAMIVWGVGLILAGVACGSISFGRGTGRSSLIALIPLLLFVLAIVPRVWQAADLPYGIWYDEAQGALEVRRVVHQGTYTPILNTYGKDTSGFFYLISALSVVLGDNILAARSAAAVVGALTVSATYLLGRELFGWRVGLAAGLLLAFMRWHINFSRLGFNPISLPLCATIAFWLLARAVRRKQWSDVGWAGLALGIGLHAYTGFRGIPVVALVALALAAVLYRWSPRVALPRFGLYVGAAVLTALPVLIFAVQDPVTFNGRTAQTLILASDASDAEKLRQIWDNVQRHALMFTVSGDLNGRHNLPGSPMLDGLTGGLVALGLGWLLIRAREWRTLMLFAWSAVVMSGGILTLAFEAPQAVRTFGVTPVLAVLGGVGLVATLDRLLSVVTLPRIVHPWRARVAASGLGAVAVAWIGFTNLDTYFNRQMPDPQVFAAFSTRETVPAKAALDTTAHYTSILTSTTMSPTVEDAYIVPDLQSLIRPFDLAGDLPYREQGPGLIFLETEHDQAQVDEVARVYPDAIRQSVRAAGGGNPIVEGFRLDQQTVSAHRGLLASYRGTDKATSMRPEAFPDVSGSTAPVDLPAEATWRGGLALDASGEYGFRIPAGFELRIDDAVLPSTPGAGVRVELVRGNHAFQLTGTVDRHTQRQLEWRPPGASQWAAIPDRALYQPPPGGMGLQLTLLPAGDPNAAVRDDFIDPVVAHYFHISPFAHMHLDARVWTAEWAGQLDVPNGGSYGFALDHSQSAGVWLDDHQILGNLSGDAANSDADIRNTIVQLAGGRHAIRVRFEKTSPGSPWINLYWSPPDAPPGIVPASAFFAPPPNIVGVVE